MSVVKQIALVAAGCQPWNLDVCAASADRFAYCATLAIYIYQWNASIREYRLESIQSEHKKTITAIAWSPYDVDLLASASADAVIIVWSVSEKHIVSRLDGCGVAPCSLAWGLPDSTGVAFVGGRGPLNVWNRSEDYGRTRNITSHLDARGFTSDVSLMRCHPKQTDKIALGHVDGSISIFGNNQKALKHVLRPDESSIVNNAADKVLSIEWDPLSTDYLLFATCNNTIFLIEALTANIIMCFELPSAAASVHSLSWIHTAPGMFLTGDANTGILRLWNVSKSTPIENFRLKKTGFRTLLVLPLMSGSAMSNCQKEGAGDVSNCNISSSNSDQLLSTSSSSSSLSFIVPPGQVLCTFLDGGVGVYDLAHRKWNFLRELGHIETIFDCQFHPEDPDILATGSFDGTIKIWDMSSLKPVFTSAGNEGVIYSLSWSPADLHCIAASTSKFGVFVLDIEKGKIVRRFNEHGESSVYTVDWNHKDARRIATTGADHYCIIHHFDGSSVVKYRHPDVVYGCDWSPHNADIIATGCADKCVRVYYLATNIDKELKTFSGHTAKVFRVKWCPLREGILVSGSDDCTVRMWDYTQEGGAIRVFQGHVAPVRGLLWNPEVPYLLMSGSWDSSIRVWDTRDGACLDTILDHGADVYGLACHPQRPFLVVSCSRDSTFRLWSLTHHVQPIEINILCSRPWNEILVSPEHAMALGTPPLLAGRASRDIKLQLDRMYTPSEARQHALLLFYKLFASPLGSNNLWQLVNVSLGQKAFQLSANYGKGIVHSRHLTQYKAAEAQELEMVKLSKFGAGLGAPSRDEQLRDAADLHIKLGNMQRYCELMIELGQWDKALALAPSVSVDYWSSLVNRRATSLVAADSTDALPYCVGSGNVPLTLQYLVSRGQHLDALLVAAAADEGSIIPTSCLATHCGSAVNDKQLDSNYVRESSDQLADWYFYNGAPLQAACCHLAVDNHKKAVCKLIRGGELELAIGVGLVLKTVDEQLKVALELLSRRCEKIGRWDLGVVLLQMVPGTEKAVARLCSRCAASMCEINTLHKSARLPSLEDCEVKANEAKSVFDRVMFYILSSSPETGLRIGLTHIKGCYNLADQLGHVTLLECMSRVGDEHWSAADVDDVLMMMASLQTERLQNAKCMRYLPELLVLCAYVGALKAAARQYNSVVPCLLRHTLFLLQRDHADVPVSEQLISDELSVWRLTHPTTSAVNSVSMVTADVVDTLSEKQLSVYQSLMSKVCCDERDEIIEAGPDCVSGSQLPSHTDVNSSCLSAQRILGPSYFLEDGHSCVSINEAVMWAKVNPFSPLGSGVRINPF